MHITHGNSDSDSDFLMAVTEIDLFVILGGATTAVLMPADRTSSEGAAGFSTCTVESLDNNRNMLGLKRTLNFILSETNESGIIVV